MKVLVGEAGIPARAKKDDRPATHIAGRNWKEYQIRYNDLPTVGFKTESGHWLYFTENDTLPVEEQAWYKLDVENIEIDPDQEVILKSAPGREKKSEEEKMAARKARRDARKAQRREEKQNRGGHTSDSDAMEELEAKELRRARRKERNAAAKAELELQRAVEEEEE